MDDDRLVELIKAARDLDIEEFEARMSSTRADCLLPSRAYALTLNPKAISDAEESHIDGCDHCRRLLERAKEEVAHAPLSMLIGKLTGRLDAASEQTLAYHLDSEACQRCNRLVSSKLLGTLAKLKDAVKTLQSAGAADRPLPALAAAFADEAPDESLGLSLDLEGDIKVRLRVTRDTSELKVHVTGPPASEGQVVEVEVIGDAGSLGVHQITLGSDIGEAYGEASFGAASEARKSLGTAVVLLAMPNVGRDPVGQ